ncbi:TadE/TadG family type IV pilus assembly protein [Massilia sp. Leaf139]|uniref:TadE/TadG family type IV pilus assembly protein n=1 Tax=Massilia sp. Leaf139 TaxID=1736272 RepID=UPI0006F2F97A|nr:TadE/TadG family type IV pilus assembly protein [Massilia sp. Leaf139]
MMGRHEAGQASTEFLVALPLLILLLFGIVQFSLIYQARSTLNHATMLAARAAALHHGDRVKMRDALASGLAPLFAKQPSILAYNQAVVDAKTDLQGPGRATLLVLNPTRAAFTDFAQARLDGKGGRELPNDTLNYRNTSRGTASRISVQDANLLHLRVTWCYRLIVPVVDRVIYATVNALGPGDAALSANGMADPFGTGGATPANRPCVKPRIEIRSEAFVRMQTPFYESNL